MKSPTSRLSRRNFLVAAGAGGIATVAAVGTRRTAGDRTPADARGGGGYRVTDHIRKYYNTAKV